MNRVPLLKKIISKFFWTGYTAWHGRDEKSFPYKPPEELYRNQNRRLKATVAFAYETVPFYRETMKRERLRPQDFKSAEDLEKLPLVSGEELSSNPERFYSNVFDKSGVLSLDTSGSTGRYKVIRHDTRAMFLARAGKHRQRIVLSHFIGRSLGYKEVMVSRRGGTGPLVLEFYDGHSWTPKGIRLKRTEVFPEDTFEKNIRIINSMEPDVVDGFGSYIGGIYRWAWAHGVRIHCPKVIFYGGDMLQEADRRIIEEEYQIPVVSSYQACEALNIAFQCEERKGFHISMDQVALRIVDEDGNRLPPGQSGEIVISNLINRATVLLNYRMSDVGRFSMEPCACERTLPVLEELQGRADDLIVLADGEVVHESVLLSKLYSVQGILQVQIIQKDMNHFIINVVCVNSEDIKKIQEKITERFFEAVGQADGIFLDIKLIGSIAHEKTGKFKSVISHCNDRGTLTKKYI
jgi:phenylacetate-CoA ligase